MKRGTTHKAFNRVIEKAAIDPDDATEIIYSSVCQLSPAAESKYVLCLWPQLTSLLEEINMKEKRKLLERWSTVSSKTCSRVAWPHLYSDHTILIKTQTMQCLFHTTAMEDWPVQNQEEPFHSQVSTFKTLGWQQWKQKISLPSLYLLSGYWLTVTAHWKHTVYHIPYPMWRIGVRHCGRYALLRLWKAQMWQCLSRARQRSTASVHSFLWIWDWCLVTEGHHSIFGFSTKRMNFPKTDFLAH